MRSCRAAAARLAPGLRAGYSGADGGGGAAVAALAAALPVTSGPGLLVAQAPGGRPWPLTLRGEPADGGCRLVSDVGE
jgi:hypothetical protein